MQLPTVSELTALFSVVAIDLTLAVDNAVVMGAAVARLPRASRKKALFFGVLAAALLRIFFACFAIKLLAVVGLTLAGGLLLLWVAWKLWRDLRNDAHSSDRHAHAGPTAHAKTTQAIVQIIFADISMSLDNTLAVAGAAHDHIWIMVGGLGLSVVLMAVAANALASAIQKHKWISYVGLAIVVYVAGKMVWEGAQSVASHV